MTIRDGMYERSYRWVDDRDGRVRVQAARMDTEFDGITEAINAIVRGTLPFSGQVLAPDGTLQAPSHSFRDAHGTGMFRKVNGDIAFVVGGQEVFAVGPTEVSHLGSAIQSVATLFGGPYTDLGLAGGADVETSVTSTTKTTHVLHFDATKFTDRVGLNPSWSAATETGLAGNVLSFNLTPDALANVEVGGVLLITHRGQAGVVNVVLRGYDPTDVDDVTERLVTLLGSFAVAASGAKRAVRLSLEANKVEFRNEFEYVLDVTYTPNGSPSGNTVFGVPYSQHSGEHRLWARRVVSVDGRALQLLEGVLAQPLSGPSSLIFDELEPATQFATANVAPENERWDIPVTWYPLIDEGKAFLEFSAGIGYDNDALYLESQSPFVIPHGTVDILTQFLDSNGGNIDPVSITRGATFSPGVPDPGAQPFPRGADLSVELGTLLLAGNISNAWSDGSASKASLQIPPGARKFIIKGVDWRNVVINASDFNTTIVSIISFFVRSVRIFFGSPRSSTGNVLEAPVLRALIEELCLKANSEIGGDDRLVLSRRGRQDELYASTTREVVAAGIRHGHAIESSTRAAANAGHLAVRGSDGVAYRMPVSSVLGGGGGTSTEGGGGTSTGGGLTQLFFSATGDGANGNKNLPNDVSFSDFDVIIMEAEYFDNFNYTVVVPVVRFSSSTTVAWPIGNQSGATIKYVDDTTFKLSNAASDEALFSVYGASFSGGDGGTSTGGTSFELDDATLDGVGLELDNGVLRLVRKSAMHERYAVWTDSANAPDATTFKAGDTSMTSTIEVSSGSGYLWFAERYDDLATIREAGSDFNFRETFSDPPTPLMIDSVQYYAYGSNVVLSPYSAAQEWELFR